MLKKHKLLISAILLTIILSISMVSLSANAKTSKTEQTPAIDQSTYSDMWLNGKRISPGAIEFTTGGFNFQKQNLSAGTHTVKIKWRIDMPTPEFGFMYYRTLTIIANGAGHP